MKSKLESKSRFHASASTAPSGDGDAPRGVALSQPAPAPVDQPRIERAVREILLAIGEDPQREGLRKTPARVARMYAELFSGLQEDPERHLEATFDEGHHEMVVLREVAFNSMCEHHLMPFEGHAHIAYIPGGRVLGLSKLARIVDAYSRRPQVQERLTSQIADLLAHKLQVKGCAVVLEAVHTCMTCRGVKKSGSVMVTSALRGLMQTNQSTRSEALSLLHRRA
ncbi:GTP cyclohydrolase 1 [Phycisphaerae bacterium RAS1]|nr:GTP cyclohydrolase 1 [Phycisphaerae bacterium RAS1]